VESFDLLKGKDKPCCLDCTSSDKADKKQTDDAYVDRSALRACEGSSNLYKYMDMFVVMTTDNKLLTAITGDLGYEPLLIYRDCLTDELNFTLENEYGLTDMVGNYTYNGDSYRLQYDMDCDAIYFSVDIKDEKIPKYFFETVSYLEKLDVKKYKN